jgi:mycothiol synthase
MLSFVLARTSGHGGIRIWVYDPAVARVVTAMGFRVERELVQMRMDLPCKQEAAPVPYVKIAPFHEADAAAWVDVNNRAFAGHPENGAWTVETLRARTQLPWFDAPGLLMGWSGPHLIGFCWTKVHPGGLGEIYVVGVDPDWQGRSVGKHLTLEGLRYLHEKRGVRSAMLYVDAAETRAVRMYRSIGFVVDHVDRSFTRSA